MAKPHHQSQVSAAKSLFCQVRVQFTLQIEQIQGGPNDGMFVAHDAVAQLMRIQPYHAARKIKNMTQHSLRVGQGGVSEDQEEHQAKVQEHHQVSMFPSCKIMKGNNQNVILVNFIPSK